MLIDVGVLATAASSYLRHHPFFKRAVPALPTLVSKHAAASAALGA
jgi:hypothetical protein